MNGLWQDLRYGIRMMLKTPVFTVVAMLTLGLGIGANTALFSMVHAILLNPLPYEDPSRIVFVSERSQRVPVMFVALPNYMDWRDKNNVFENMGAFRGNTYNLSGFDDPERIIGTQATREFFTVLGVSPMVGRIFTPEEDSPGGERVMLLSHSLWQRRFGSDPNVLGRALTLNDEVFTVIGVMPPDFAAPTRINEIWTSLGRISDEGWLRDRGMHAGTFVYARLKPGVSIQRAQTEMDVIASQLGEEYPKTNSESTVFMQDLTQWVVGTTGSTLWILWGAVGIVLLIACANIANLLLARSMARQREIAMRAALGARRGRLIQQLLTEGVLLALCSSVLGVVIGYWGMEALKFVMPENTPRIYEVSLNGSVLIFTLIITLLTGVLFGLAPAMHLTRPSLNAMLREGGRGTTAGRQRLRTVLVVSEVALCLVLLISAGLIIKSFMRIRNSDMGFQPEGVLTVQMSLPNSRYGDARGKAAFLQQLTERLDGALGISGVGAATPMPLNGSWQDSFVIEGAPPLETGQSQLTDLSRVSSDYFSTMQIKLLNGRYFTEQDNAGALPVAIVDETFVRNHMPEQNPVGRRIRVGKQSANTPWLTIVGVVDHTKNYGADQQSRVETYVPYAQNPSGQINLVLRTKSEPTAIASTLRGVIADLDRNLPIYNIRPYDYYVTSQIGSRRLSLVLFIAFASIAVVLAVIGIYGVLSYMVTQRTHEIGIRMALGAQASNVLGLVIKQGLLLAGIGVTLGLIGAFALNRVISSLLFEVSSTDLIIFVGVPLLLIIVSMLACYIPARRAARIDPMIALRQE